MENLKVRTSNFKQEMSCNEWVNEVNFGRWYVKPTEYYQGNPSWGERPQKNIVNEILLKIKSFFIFHY